MEGRAWATAPGKVILFGEHAVVYGRPAIAAPIMQVKAHAVAAPGRPDTGIVLHAKNLGRRYMMAVAPPGEPLAYTCRTVLRLLEIESEPSVILALRSEIPIASGLGSGAATAAAVARALSRWLGWEFSPAQLSSVVYETEKLHHGTPSGIDNTVVAYERPVWFRRGEVVKTFVVGAPLELLVADTGIASPTRQTVNDVRLGWQREPERYERLFDHIATVGQAAHEALARGDAVTIGRLMTENHGLLQALGVSSPENDRLVEAALATGALGAKLSGGGRGGNNVVLVPPGQADRVAAALRRAGAVRVLRSTLE